MFKFLASADLHLGRRSTSLPDAAIDTATSEVWKQLVKKAIELNVDAVLLSGDVIDRENRFFEAVGQLQKGFEDLQNAGIPLFMVAGNHDYDVLADAISDKWPGIHLLGASGEWEVFPFKKDGKEVQILGWSFPTQHYRQNPLETLPANRINSGLPTVGLLHGDLDNPLSPYAPLTSDDLFQSGVHAWVLGHIHKPAHIELHGKHIWYPGSPQALSPKETGVHGAILIEVHSALDIKHTAVPLSAIRYENLPVQIEPEMDDSGIRNGVQSTIDNFTQGLTVGLDYLEHLVLDMELVGSHTDIINVENVLREIVKDYYTDRDGVKVSVRKVSNALIPAVSNLETLAEQSSPAGLLAQAILALQKNETTKLVETLREKWLLAFDSVQNAPVYSDLRYHGREQRYFDEQKERQDTYLLQACKKLLGELMQQKEPTEK